MPNIRVRARLERLQTELNAIRDHVAFHRGIAADDARAIDNVCADLAEQAAMIAADARKAMGNTSGRTLVRDVRRALGFTKP